MPIIKLQTVRILLAIGCIYNLKIRLFDVVTAYLYGELKEETYMEQPPGFGNGKNEICRLIKSIYGLPQSGRYWNETMNDIFVKMGLERIREDPCVYIMREEEKIVIIGVYVDDFLVLGTDNIIIDRVTERLMQYFKLTETTNKKFLNISITETDIGLELSQERYISTIVEKFGLQDCNIAKTPLDPQQNLDDYETSPPVDATAFQEIIGFVMYLNIGTRPDVTHAISRLSQYSANPRHTHLVAAKESSGISRGRVIINWYIQIETMN